MEEIQQRADARKKWSDVSDAENPSEVTVADYQAALAEMGVEL